jgi:hypothetical protein
MLARATSACFGTDSKVMRRPSGGSALASQIVLQPPSVPNSRIRRALTSLASRLSSLPCVGETPMAGSPAASLAASAAATAASGSTSAPVM